MSNQERRWTSAISMRWIAMGLVVLSCSSDETTSGGPGSGDASLSAGGSAGAGGAPAIDPAALMTSLSDAELGEICDWMYGKLGGYGAVIQCTGVGQKIIHNPADRAACLPEVSFLPGACRMTVGQWEACTEARVPSQGCAFPDAECNPYFFCSFDHDR